MRDIREPYPVTVSAENPPFANVSFFYTSYKGPFSAHSAGILAVEVTVVSTLLVDNVFSF